MFIHRGSLAAAAEKCVLHFCYCYGKYCFNLYDLLRKRPYTLLSIKRVYVVRICSWVEIIDFVDGNYKKCLIFYSEEK